MTLCLAQSRKDAKQSFAPLRLCARHSDSLQARNVNLLNSLAADFAKDVFGHVDGNFGRNCQGDGVAGPAVHFHELSIDSDAELGEIGVIAQLANEDVLKVPPHAIDD